MAPTDNTMTKPTDTQVTDLIVQTGNPVTLDKMVRTLGQACVVPGTWNWHTCRVRVYGEPGYIRWAIKDQCYGRVVSEEPVDDEPPAAR